MNFPAGLKEKVVITAGIIGGVTLLYYLYQSEDNHIEKPLTNRGSDLDRKLVK